MLCNLLSFYGRKGTTISLIISLNIEVTQTAYVVGLFRGYLARSLVSSACFGR